VEFQQMLAMLLASIAFVVLLIFGLDFLTHALPRLWERRKILQLAKDNPELLKLLETPKKEHKIRAAKIRGKVRVLQFYGDKVVDQMCKTEDGIEIVCKKATFYVPQDYRPYLTTHGRQVYLTYLFDADGKAIQVAPDKIERKAPNPYITNAIVNRNLLRQVFSGLYFSWHQIVMGMGIGIMMMTFMIFVLLPLLGYPVTIGKTPVEVTVRTVAEGSWLPPPGNFTPTVPR
jgi:hypothetical protein